MRIKFLPSLYRKDSSRQSRPMYPFRGPDPMPFPGQCEPEDFRRAVKAASRGDVSVLEEMMVVHGKNLVNWKSDSNQSLLHYAVRHEKLAVVKFLVENRADINAYDSVLNTVFHYGAKFQSPQCLRYLLKLLKGLAKNKLGGLKLEKGDLAIAKSLVDDPAIDGRTPLHYAGFHKDPEIAGMILRALYVLFDPEDFIKAATRLDCDFHTAAHFACRYNSVRVLRLYLDPYECFRTIGEGWSVCKMLVAEVHKRLQTPDLKGRCLDPTRKAPRPKHMSLMDYHKRMKGIRGPERDHLLRTLDKILTENKKLEVELAKARNEPIKQKIYDNDSYDSDDSDACYVEVADNVLIEIPSIDLNKLNEKERKEREIAGAFPARIIRESVVDRFKTQPKLIKDPSPIKEPSRSEFNSSELRCIYSFSSLSTLENSGLSGISDLSGI